MFTCIDHNRFLIINGKAVKQNRNLEANKENNIIYLKFFLPINDKKS